MKSQNPDSPPLVNELSNPSKPSNMNICEQLVHDAQNATSLDELTAISDRADNLFLVNDNQEYVGLMTDDFWLTFTKVIRKRSLSLTS